MTKKVTPTPTKEEEQQPVVLLQVVQKVNGTIDLVITPGVTAGMVLQLAQMMTRAVNDMPISFNGNGTDVIEGA